MKDISRLGVYLNFELENEIIPKLIVKQQEAAIEVKNDIVSSSPVKTGQYMNSIKVSETEYKNDVIKTDIYSDLKIGGDNPKWAKVPLANLINWGTGPLGEKTNIYPHKYSYTTDEPWNFIALLQYINTGTWGMRANPHFYLSLQKNVPKILKKYGEAFEE